MGHRPKRAHIFLSSEKARITNTMWQPGVPSLSGGAAQRKPGKHLHRKSLRNSSAPVRWHCWPAEFGRVRQGDVAQGFGKRPVGTSMAERRLGSLLNAVQRWKRKVELNSSRRPGTTPVALLRRTAAPVPPVVGRRTKKLSECATAVQKRTRQPDIARRASGNRCLLPLSLTQKKHFKPL